MSHIANHSKDPGQDSSPFSLLHGLAYFLVLTTRKVSSFLQASMNFSPRCSGVPSPGIAFSLYAPFSEELRGVPYPVLPPPPFRLHPPSFSSLTHLLSVVPGCHRERHSAMFHNLPWFLTVSPTFLYWQSFLSRKGRHFARSPSQCPVSPRLHLLCPFPVSRWTVCLCPGQHCTLPHI